MIHAFSYDGASLIVEGAHLMPRLSEKPLGISLPLGIVPSLS